MKTPMDTPIVGRTAAGTTVWYTGRSGTAWISPDARDAFRGYPLERARRVALKLNRRMHVHGIYFVACAGDLARATAPAAALREES